MNSLIIILINIICFQYSVLYYTWYHNKLGSALPFAYKTEKEVRIPNQR